MRQRAGQWALVFGAGLAFAPARTADAELPKSLSRYAERSTLIERRPVVFSEAFSKRNAKALVLNFFEHDCAPCRAELPEVEALANEPGVELWILAITPRAPGMAATCKGRDRLTEFFEGKSSLKARVLLDDCGSFLSNINGSNEVALPITFLLNEKLEIIQIQRGRAEGRKLSEVFDAALRKLRG